MSASALCLNGPFASRLKRTVALPVFAMIAVLILAVLGNPHAALACGPDTDCKIGTRYYRISLPDRYDGDSPVGAIVYAHGYGGSPRGVMRNMGLRRMVSRMGLALIAVKSLEKDWVIPNVADHPDTDGAEEISFFEDVVADASARFALDTQRMMMAGYSAGGMMAWNLACARPGLFAGFMPIAGTFWEPPPDQCERPVASIMHMHGTLDRVVPLAGRVIGTSRQGNVAEVLEMYRSFGEFGPIRTAQVADMECQRQSNLSGAILEFCLFPGAHSFRRGFLRYGWERLEAAGKL